VSADDRSAIENLLYTYAERMDAGDLAGVAQLFEHAAYRAGDGPALRWEQVERVNRELVILHEDGTPRTKHLTTNARIEVDETAGTASAHSYFTVIQGVAGTPLQPIVAGRYQDRFERVDGGWRFSERRIHVDLVGDLSRHLRHRPAQI
jgi:3-phenylpropionate/cinnamic acid dioxygenase small subunit